MDRRIREIAGNFAFEGEPVEAIPCALGHINDTYAVRCGRGPGGTRRYILQRIDHRVFRNPVQMMENIARVTRHLRDKIAEAGGDPERETLTIVPTAGGESFLLTGEGEYWRAYVFIENAHSSDMVENPGQFFQAGRLLGKFQGMLSDFPIEELHETIPGFHDTGKRFVHFIEAVKGDAAGRFSDVKAEIDFVMDRAHDASTLVNLVAAGALKPRVTHNDTKFNNVMIDDRTEECVCLVDLDTVMPGLYLNDFGDSIRSGANTGLEDEKDLAKVSLDLGLYERFMSGYLESAGAFLTPLELELLPFAARMMTFECGMRFLTDYLNGDTYFRIRRPGHNLDRARTQFRLVADMEDKMETMMKTVERLEYTGKRD